MITRSQLKKQPQNKSQIQDESYSELSYGTDLGSDVSLDSDSEYFPSECSNNDDDLQSYVDIASDKLIKVILWLNYEAHLDDKLDTLEKIDELFNEKEKLGFTRITDETLKMLRNNKNSVYNRFAK